MCASNPINSQRKSALFVLVTVVPPGLHVTVVPDSMMVSTGRVGESLGAIRARVGFLAGAISRSQRMGH